MLSLQMFVCIYEKDYYLFSSIDNIWDKVFSYALCKFRYGYKG